MKPKFFGPYKDLLDCKEVDLEKFQEKGLSGLYCSSHDDRFGVSKATNFNKCQWWKAEFDKESAKTLWKYFAAPMDWNCQKKNGKDIKRLRKTFSKFWKVSIQLKKNQAKSKFYFLYFQIHQ